MRREYKWGFTVTKSDWRSSADYIYLNDADPADLAWEFLRRNPDYRRDVDRLATQQATGCSLDDHRNQLAKKWGLRFIVDPNKDSRNAIHWHEDHFPRLLTLVETKDGSETAPISLVNIVDPASSREDRAYLNLPDGKIFISGWNCEASRNTIAVPLDMHLRVRLAELQRLEQRLFHAKLTRAARFLTIQHAARLIMSLRALDGHQRGHSYRIIAEGLFGAHRVPKQTWKTHDLRDRTIRLVQKGLSLMRGRYRDLLLIKARD